LALVERFTVERFKTHQTLDLVWVSELRVEVEKLSNLVWGSNEASLSIVVIVLVSTLVFTVLSFKIILFLLRSIFVFLVKLCLFFLRKIFQFSFIPFAWGICGGTRGV